MSYVECIVLGFLHEGMRYGHEIDKAIEDRQIRKWVSISRMGVYKTLNRLTERGWVETNTEKEGKMPERTVYKLTKKGEEALQEMIARDLASDEPMKWEYGVPVMYLHILPPTMVVELLQKRIKVIQGLRHHLESHYQEVKSIVPLGPLAVMKKRRMMYRVEERWLKWLMKQVEEKGISNDFFNHHDVHHTRDH